MIFILSISEIWAMLFPVSALYYRKKLPSYLRPVKWYIVIALVLNIFAVAVDKRLGDFTGLRWLMNNNYIYNLHSIIRFVFFCIFFERLRQPFLISLKKNIPYVMAAFVVTNFILLEDFFESFSSNLFSIEAGALLFYCLQYYVFKSQEETLSYKTADFWVTTGLSIYVVFNFPFFLLYTSLSAQNQSLWWNIHNVSYIIFCIFISKAFYVAENER